MVGLMRRLTAISWAVIMVCVSFVHYAMGFVHSWAHRSTTAVRTRSLPPPSSPAQSQISRCSATLVPQSCLLNDKEHTICIVGGGFGGLYTALQLSKTVDSRTALVLIDPKDRFVFSPLLYELAMSSVSISDVAPRYEDLLAGTAIRFVQGVVDTVDFEKRLCEVRLAVSQLSAVDEVTTTPSHCTVRYDQLVLATGTQPRLDLIPGAREHSLPFYRVQDADRLQSRLRELQRQKCSHGTTARVAVIGAGFSGIEIATSIAQFLGRCGDVTIIDRNDKVLPASPAHNRDQALRSLNSFGVHIRHRTSVKSVSSDGLLLLVDHEPEEFLAADLILFTAGMEQSQFIKQLSLTKDRYGRISTRSTLQSVDRDEIFALGDCCGVEGATFPSTGQVAMQESFTVAKNVHARWELAKKLRNAVVPVASAVSSAGNSNGQSQCNSSAATQISLHSTEATAAAAAASLEEFEFQSLGEMLSLGDSNAAITAFGGLFKLHGPLAAFTRRLIYASRMPTTQQMAQMMWTAGSAAAGRAFSKLFGDRAQST